MRDRISEKYLSRQAIGAMFIPILTVAIAWLITLADFSQGSAKVPLDVVQITVFLAAVAVIVFHWRSQVQLARLAEQAHTDSLCGLPNRRALHHSIQHGVKGGEEIALALIDLDGFKAVNDFYGHVVGDQVIKLCATMFSEQCEGVGKAYRLGGDEFALVATGPLAGNILEGLCRRLLDRLTLPMIVGDRSIVIGASVGLSRGVGLENPGSSELLRQSDVAMYVSKARGKARITWFSVEFDIRRQLQQRIDADLRVALRDGHLRVFYQPLIDVCTGTVTSVEALLRWERPDGEQIGPDKFIPIAEETGLIEAIGLWVLRQACIDGLAWPEISMSVNVSSAQLRNPQFPIHLGQILEETGFPPSRLELEITETYVVCDPVMANRNLELIREFGVSIVLDDYGTGFASIGFLRKFRFEKLKLDRSLLVDAVKDESTRAIMTSSVAVAKALGIKVTAEGVETEIHAQLARVSGCDQMQGWLYSKALPINALNLFLDSNRLRIENLAAVKLSA